MVSHPEQWISDFKDAGVDLFTFHVEAVADPHHTIKAIRDAGMKVGIALSPKTPVERVLPFVESVDMVLVMTVEPGFGGQKFMEDMMPKVSLLRDKYPALDIEVDGGLTKDTIEKAAAAGANVIVVGSALFGSKNPAELIQVMKSTVEKYPNNSQ